MPGPVWVVLPTYQEAAGLAALVAAVRAVLPGAVVLVVDDASPDGTGAVADGLAAADPGVRVLHRPGKAGLGRAYAAGFGVALAGGAEVVVQMDADFSHSPADLPRLAGALAAADVAIGSRYVAGGGVAGWGRTRRLVSRGGCWYARRLLRVPVRDLTSGFKAWRADALEAIAMGDSRAEGYAFQVETTYRALLHGLRVTEVPITFHERAHGRSKMTLRIAFEAAWMVPALRRRRPRRGRRGGGRVTPGPSGVSWSWRRRRGR